MFFIHDKKLILPFVNLTSCFSDDEHFEDAIDIAED